ncbi:rhomboid family intramembrane serine protease [Actinopolymorpha pittospori]|uniref:Membrane associated rhomboid family serine protease n=1 Tax=Actinopolymorpha pittospori TaxID=648752 RepID=A0A927MS00_9ACTN|nr:rhomboid family intramembrane serine protease [Actinopolymorpha pittospori]MBE1605054.1 membrane associated rhomboid family serine protease [Actinopolymorpha pittospori]
MTENPRPDESAEAQGASGPSTVPRCYRHPERETYIRCQRCGRHICPDCQRQAAVGFQCVECVNEGRRSTPAARTRFGGVMRGGDGATVTKVLLGLNILVYVLTLLLGPAVEQQLSLVGNRSFFADAIGESSGVAGGAYWRLITSTFLHIQLWHLAVNMFSLWVLGPSLERLLGRLRFTGLYLVAGLAGSAVAYAFTSPLTPILGASGAIFGLFGATVAVARRMRADMSWFVGALIMNIVLNVVFRSYLSWQGHVGGFLAGLALGAVVAYAPRDRRNLMQGLGFGAVILASVALIIWRTVQLTSGGVV